MQKQLIAHIEQCHINYLSLDSKCESMTISNSVIYRISRTNSLTSTLLVKNCVINSDDYQWPMSAVFRNSIFRSNETSQSCSYYNCAYYHSNLTNVPSVVKDCVFLYGAWDSSLFTGYYVLNDDWKSKLIGTDGKEMGIYGGDTPFSVTPSNPQITTRDIADETDSNGKLAVKIVVEAQ